MKKKVIMLISILVAVSCIAAIVVSANGDLQGPTQEPVIERVNVEYDKTYYAYCNTSTSKGAVAFSLDNEFVSFGSSEKNLQLCTKNEDGTYKSVYTVTQDKAAVWFAGKQEYSLTASDNIKNLLGGLSSVGITLDCEKTNVAFGLSGFILDSSAEYYVYIPEDFFVDAQGKGNTGAYIAIDTNDVRAYTGNIIQDIAMAASDVYDIALFGIESLTGLIG